MKVAIALFKTRVSPRFDYAQEFLIAETANGEVLERRQITAGDWYPLERIKNLANLEVNTLICGAIDRCSMEHLNSLEIEIYCCVTGEAEDALRCLIKGSLESDMMVGPGGCCCGHWHFRGNGGHHGMNRKQIKRNRR